MGRNASYVENVVEGITTETTMELFTQPSVKFEKLAAEVTLPEDPNAWPNEITQELFKQVPYIADFEPHVVMDKVDAERGYGFGHVEVTNKTEIQHGASPEGLASAGVRSAKIPVIIKDRKLQAFDVLVTEDSSMLPLTEARLRQAIFRPQNFDITARTPGDMSMIGQLYPPYRQNYGMGGGSGASMSAGMGKEGKSKLGSVLKAILPTITAQDYGHFYELLDDAGMRAAFVKNAGATLPSLRLLSTCEPANDEKVASDLFDNIKPTVVQLVREVEGYTLKTANHRCWTVKRASHDRGDMVRIFGEKVVLAADLSGSATMGLGGEAPPAPMEEEQQPQLIKDFGVYQVRDEQGAELVGHVFPNLIDVDGTPLPLALFWNGEKAAVQGEIVGTKVGDDVPLVEGHPRGRGCFYDVSGEEPIATIPLAIRATLAGGEEGGGVALMAETFDGREVGILIQPNLAHVMMGEGEHMLVPDTMKWLPLDDAEEVALLSESETAEKMAHRTRAFATVQIRAGGAECFSIDGLPLLKIAASERSFLSTDDALFLLVGLGVHPQRATEKLAEAIEGRRPIEVKIARSLCTAGEAVDVAVKEAQADRAKLPDLRVWLVKEAAAIPDPTAVDTILSLGFINPENTATFIEYLPQIEEAQKKMCELLVASRLGMQEVPSSALEKAVRSTELVLEGLKVLAFQAN